MSRSAARNAQSAARAAENAGPAWDCLYRRMDLGSGPSVDKKQMLSFISMWARRPTHCHAVVARSTLSFIPCGPAGLRIFIPWLRRSFIVLTTTWLVHPRIVPCHVASCQFISMRPHRPAIVQICHDCAFVLHGRSMFSQVSRRSPGHLRMDDLPGSNGPLDGAESDVLANGINFAQ